MLEFDLEKSFGDFTLRVAERVGCEWLVLLAPSGAGKSLLLNLLSGLVRPERGWVRLAGETLFDQGARINLPIRRRRLGYLLQDYALFPHLTVAANIAYGLPRGKHPAREVARWVRFFHLEGREGAFPRELSGGQQQRVALARTLASGPRALLLDEPFSALDRRTRERLQVEMVRLKAELSLPVILVTHDFMEARLLGDRVAVLEEGRVLEVGRKDWIFAHPRRHRTARFLGVDNVLPATALPAPTELTGPAESLPAGEGGCVVSLAGRELRLQGERSGPAAGQVHLCIHAADVRLVLDDKARPNTLRGTVAEIHPEGGTNRVVVRLHPTASGLAGTEPSGTKLSGMEPAEDMPLLELLVDDYVRGRHGIDLGRPVTLWLPEDKLFLCD